MKNFKIPAILITIAPDPYLLESQYEKGKISSRFDLTVKIITSEKNVRLYTRNVFDLKDNFIECYI